MRKSDLDALRDVIRRAEQGEIGSFIFAATETVPGRGGSTVLAQSATMPLGDALKLMGLLDMAKFRIFLQATAGGEKVTPNGD